MSNTLKEKNSIDRENQWICQKSNCIYTKNTGKKRNKNKIIYSDLPTCHNDCEDNKLQKGEQEENERIIQQQELEDLIEEMNEPPKEIMATVLFSDIKGSSKLWQNYPDAMYSALLEHEIRMNVICKQFQGMIVKTIGDSFFIVFPNLLDTEAIFYQSQQDDNNNNNTSTKNNNNTNRKTSKTSNKNNKRNKNQNNNNHHQYDLDQLSPENIDTLKRAIEFAITVQNNLYEDPIYVGTNEEGEDENITVRIGIAFGQVYLRSTFIQHNLRVIDLFGNAVNTASRAESKVSQPGGFAFAIVTPSIDAETAITPEIDSDAELVADAVLNIIPTYYNITKTAYLEDCPRKKKNKSNIVRSQRLINFVCNSIEELRGVSQVLIYNVNLQ